MITQFRNNSYRWSAAGIGLIAALSAICLIDPTRGAAPASAAAPAKPAPQVVKQPAASAVAAVELLRRQMHGAASGLQRTARVVQRARR